MLRGVPAIDAFKSRVIAVIYFGIFLFWFHRRLRLESVEIDAEEFVTPENSEKNYINEISRVGTLPDLA